MKKGSACEASTATPEARMESPIHVPRKPIGGMMKAAQRHPFFAVALDDAV